MEHVFIKDQICIDECHVQIKYGLDLAISQISVYILS